MHKVLIFSISNFFIDKISQKESVRGGAAILI